MKSLRVFAAVIAVSAVVGLAACAPTPVVAPITVNVGDLQSQTVEVPVNSVLNINTGDLAVDSYTATIADTSIASFVQGRTDGSATFNPGLKPLKVGETKVTLANKDGGIQNVVFVMKVIAAGTGK
ncbi:hypothetical protein BH11ACT4_BH11ACT4_09320 [soil metagenome]